MGVPGVFGGGVGGVMADWGWGFQLEVRRFGSTQVLSSCFAKAVEKITSSRQADSVAGQLAAARNNQSSTFDGEAVGRAERAHMPLVLHHQ